jgi:hypothetical protein
MTCHHTWFLKDLSSAVSERISAEVGNDWRVKCGHCGMSVAGSHSLFEAKPVALRWVKNNTWFGELGMERGTE